MTKNDPLHAYRKKRGGYALTRIRIKPENWLLAKMNDSEAQKAA